MFIRRRMLKNCLKVGNYKIIYKIQTNTIYITDVFDTRQDPDKIKERNKWTSHSSENIWLLASCPLPVINRQLHDKAYSVQRHLKGLQPPEGIKYLTLMPPDFRR